MITLRFLDNLTAFTAVTSRSQRVQDALVTKINQLNTRLQAHIQVNKLMGDVLHYVTGTLFRSVEVIPAQVVGNKISGGVQSSAGPAFYGKFHEQGRPEPWEIRPVEHHLLRFIGRDGKPKYMKSVIHPGLPERSFMRSSQEEMAPQFVEELRETVYNVLSAQPRDAGGRFQSWD